MIDVTTGPYCCGSTGDDTAGLQAAIDDAIASGQRSILIPIHCRVSAPLRLWGLGFTILGYGPFVSGISALGNFEAILSFEAGAMYHNVTGLDLQTSGTTTRCAQVKQDAVVIRFSRMYFAGDLVGDLVYSNGHNVDFDKSTWQVSSPATWGINFDSFNQNPGVVDCRFGGIGQGIRVTNDYYGLARVEGLKLTHSYLITTGDCSLWLGSSYVTTLNGCVLDQAGGRALYVGPGAENVSLMGGYLGTSKPLDALGMHIAPDAGTGHSLMGTTIGYAGYGIFCDATPTQRVTGLEVSGVMFKVVKNPLILDSVAKCVLRGNIDLTTPANGSVNFKGTHGYGDYCGGNNRWGPGGPAMVDPTSNYNFVNDTRG